MFKKLYKKMLWLKMIVSQKIIVYNNLVFSERVCETKEEETQ